MIEFEQWVASRPYGRDREFLVLGKGPTFARRTEFDLSSYVTISLNHVVEEQSVDIAHMIDFDVAQACAESIGKNARWLLMPRHPHLVFQPSLLSLSDFVRTVPALKQLEGEGRIIQYDLTGPGDPSRRSIEVEFFSSEAAVEIAARLGASRIRTLGIDGGTRYAASFSAMNDTTRLANGQPTFSRQFSRLQEVADRHDVTVEALISPLKVFVGAQERELIAAQVLEYSIDQHATEPVQVIHLPAVSQRPRDKRNHQRTPFSFSRFLIPELMGYRGRGLYLDSDMQVFDDITRLWEIPMGEAHVLCTNQTFIPEQWRDNADFHPGRQFSVMMLDCDRLDWNIDEVIHALDSGRLTYEQLMFEMGLVESDRVSDRLPEEWNHLEHYIPGRTKLIHYTAVPTQPWKSDKNPNGPLWEAAFGAALRAGYVDPTLVSRHIRAGHVRSSLRRLVAQVPPLEPRPAGSMEAELMETRRRLAATNPAWRKIPRVAFRRLRRW